MKNLMAIVALGAAAIVGPSATGASETVQQRALSIARAMNGQIKPHWHAPGGRDAEKLVTVLSWDLDRTGILSGPPKVVRQEGLTHQNKRFAEEHARNAIRAVKEATPFRLPVQDYEIWKHVGEWRFDRAAS